MAVSTGAAILGAGAMGLAGGILGGQSQAEAASGAAASSLAATRETNAMLKEQYEQTRQDYEPWRVAGEQALQQIQDMPSFQFTAADFDAFSDPSYTFRKNEAIQALDRSAAARGRVLSGSQDKAVTRYASDLASQEYQNAFNRALTTYGTNLGTQQSLANVGLSSTGAVSQAGGQTAGRIGATTMQGSQAAANALMAGGQAKAGMYGDIAQTVNQGMGNYLLYQSLQPSAKSLPSLNVPTMGYTPIS